MISDAYVKCVCDTCFHEEEVDLTALATRESYDMRNVRTKLVRLGWKVDGDNLKCVDCVQSAQEEDEP